MMRKSFPLSLLAGVALGSAAMLLPLSEAPAQMFGSHNSNAPIAFDASRIEVQDRADRVLLTGGVRVEQAGLVVNSGRMTVAYSNASGVEVNRLTAAGGVTVTKNGDRATGDVAIYDLDRRQITMVGNVTLLQNNNRLNGGRVVIDLRSGRAIVDGRATGGAPGVTQGSGGRVSGTFTVPQRGN